MPKAFKWIIALFAGLAALVLIAALLAPYILNLERYKPVIANKITEATGRPVTIGGQIKPSIFPWLGIAVTDLHVGNPEGFESPEFVAVDAFQVRIKLIPLLSREVRIDRLVLEKPVVYLEKNKKGVTNWENLGPQKTAPPQTTPESQPPASKDGLPIKTLQVDEVALTEGRVIWIDQSAAVRKQIEKINLLLTDVSFDRPMNLQFSAVPDGKPVSLKGTIGPLGPKPGESPIPLNLEATVVEAVAINIQGRVENPNATPAIDLNVAVAPFSPRRLLDVLNQPLPFQPADQSVLEKVELAFKLNGTPQQVAVSDGKLMLDDTRMTFTAKARDFDKPDLTLAATVDQINLDRYLPTPAASEPVEKPAEEKPAGQPAPEPDYAPLRKLVLDAGLKVGQMTVSKIPMQDMEVKIQARNGILRINPMQVNLYEGSLVTTGTINVQQPEPRSEVKLLLKGLQAGPLLQNLMEKDILRGLLSADLNLMFSGDQPVEIRRSLDGQGTLLFKDGAIVGIDLAGMVRNVQAAVGLAERPDEKPKTDFSELLVPFNLNKGTMNLNGAKLSSPLMRVEANGKVNLVEETLDLRVDPKFVATLVGQNDPTQQRSGIMVPVNVSGTFKDPRFRPDLQAIISQPLGNEQAEQKRQELQQEIDKKKKEVEEGIQQKAQELFKKLPFGNQ